MILQQKHLELEFVLVVGQYMFLMLWPIHFIPMHPSRDLCFVLVKYWSGLSPWHCGNDCLIVTETAIDIVDETIIWTNTDQIHFRIYAALAGDEFSMSMSIECADLYNECS